jgi:hypothetical protein
VLLCFATLLLAQQPVPGPNVNMVSGTQFPDGDPYLQRQNEPTLAVSTRNPQHLLVGANDYRTVDIPNPLDDGRVIGDAWVGVFKSADGGMTWESTLMPGYAQDTSTTGSGSPLKAFAVAMDPTVRAGTHGTFYYSGLVSNRGNNAPSEVFGARFQDRNHGGNGDPSLYIDAKLVDSGTSGQFLDKPWIATGIPGRSWNSANTCRVNGTTFSAENVYLVYSVFLGSTAGNPHSQIVMAPCPRGYLVGYSPAVSES